MWTNAQAKAGGGARLALAVAFSAAALLALAACGTGTSFSDNTIVVNSLDDAGAPASGIITLRSAVDQAGSGDTITFDSSLDGGTIHLTIVAEEHSTLKGEIYSGMTFEGYGDRDYGKSALYARKSLTIDASELPHGITVEWGGGDADPARVLAVYGNLTMKNVTISGGYAAAEPIPEGTQAYTLGRGGGLAVWGVIRLENCTVSGNRAAGDDVASRDRGAYGGGIYANGILLEDCVVSGNSVTGYGAGGGGIYSVGGADNTSGAGFFAKLTRCAVSGNRVTAQHAYGGGIFTLSGGPNNLATMTLTNCTVARNLVEDNPALPEAGQYYYRGGGVYMGGGSLALISCTVAENAVTGNLAEFSGKPNMAGGGICATIGNAHVVENVEVQHSIIVGNTVNGDPADLYSGSLLDFYSRGYNLIGALDFSQILVPCPEWMTLSRKHYPKAGDADGLEAAAILDLGAVQVDDTILSAGTDSGQPVALWYPPLGAAVDRIPAGAYSVTSVFAGYQGYGVATDDFLNQVLIKLRTDYGAILGNDFGTEFGDLTGVTWYGPSQTWPTDPANAAWIAFWRDLDVALGDSLGTVKLGDGFWGTFSDGVLGDVTMDVTTDTDSIQPVTTDQLGNSRPRGSKLDVGAIEK